MIVLQFIAILIIYLFVPESPAYLYEKGMFKGLENSLVIIGSINRVSDVLPKVKYAVIRLKIKRQNEDGGDIKKNDIEEED